MGAASLPSGPGGGIGDQTREGSVIENLIGGFVGIVLGGSVLWISHQLSQWLLRRREIAQLQQHWLRRN